MRKTGQRDRLPGALKMMILRIVRRKPSHDYALVQHIKRTSHDLLQIEEGSLYQALEWLLKEGWSRLSGASLLQTAAFGFTD
jgi:DNA-binding PadR family transcriptional regulator